MNSLAKRIELLINIAIIVIALLLGGVLAKRYLWPSDHAASTSDIDPRIPSGMKASLPDVDWAKNGQTLLLVLSRHCHFCSESAPFYQRLVQEAEKNGNTRIVAVLPQEIDEGKKYLSDLGVPIGEVKQAGLDAIGVTGTPTLILVDRNGIVKNSWVGKLSAPEESEILSRLRV